MSNRVNDLNRSAGQWDKIARADVETLLDKEKQYKGSWKKRGGTGAYENLCRKWDRIEAAAGGYGNNIFMAAAGDERRESILDDIGDLRRYLMLVEGEVRLMREDGERAVEQHRPSILTPPVGDEGDYGLPSDYRSPGYRMPESDMSDVEDLTQNDIDEIRRQAANHARAQAHDPGLNVAHAACTGEIEDLKERITNLNRALLSEEEIVRDAECSKDIAQKKTAEVLADLVEMSSELMWWASVQADVYADEFDRRVKVAQELFKNAAGKAAEELNRQADAMTQDRE